MSDSDDPLQLNLTISAPDRTEDEIDTMTRQLLRELKGFDIEYARLVAGIAPEGTMGVDSATVGAITMAVLPTILPKVLEFLQLWSLQGKGRTIKFKGKVAGQNIDFEGSFAEMEKLVELLEKKQKKQKR